MSPARGAVWMTVVLLGATVLVSGPAVTGVDLTDRATMEPIGSGSAEIVVVSFPTDSVRIESGRFGAGLALRVPSATIELKAVTGSPTIVYEIVIPDLGFARTELHFLSETDAGSRIDLRMDAVTFDPGSVPDDRYRADLRIGVRRGTDTEIRYQRNVSVPVRR